MAEGDKSTNTTTTSSTNPQIDAVWQRIGERAKTASNIKAAKNKTKKKAVITTGIILVTILLAVAGLFIWRHYSIANTTKDLTALLTNAQTEASSVITNFNNDLFLTRLENINCPDTIKAVDQSTNSINQLTSKLNNPLLATTNLGSNAKDLAAAYNNYLTTATDIKNICTTNTNLSNDIAITTSATSPADLSTADKQTYVNSLTNYANALLNNTTITNTTLKQAVTNYANAQLKFASYIQSLANGAPNNQDEADYMFTMYDYLDNVATLDDETTTNITTISDLTNQILTSLGEEQW